MTKLQTKTGTEPIDGAVATKALNHDLDVVRQRHEDLAKHDRGVGSPVTRYHQIMAAYISHKMSKTKH